MTAPAAEMRASGTVATLETAAADPAEDSCPICGHAGAALWLRAPDRFHGREVEYTLLRCPSCSLVWLTNPPKPEEMGEHYTEAYDRLISAAGQNSPFRWADRKAALTQYKQSGSILDLGCSSGAFLESLSAADWKLYGIEMSAESAKAAQRRTGAKVFVGDILDADFPPASFDVITCFDVLEHLYEPRRVMGKVAEWLKPGGIFYVLVPNIDSAEGRVFGSYWHGLELPRHLFHYCPASLTRLADSVGLRQLSVETRRNPAVGTSLRYVWHDVCRSIGIPKTPVAYRREARLPWRAARKVVRMTLLRALLAMAPLAGGGESIHAIFRKDSADGAHS
ncbi:MAG TPA: class I SAM-dependent methyltransferase [Terracidiphilus sp.]|nr:class I SAM-dependent methyltransferase [Terracidiphilus sp.]HEV2463249.1 class I SAM-dependent methyltransferase [Acidobacteriaceae bacterium]